MPIARIFIKKGKTFVQKKAISEAIQQALVESIKIPADDYFQIFSEHDAEDFFYDKNYLGIHRSNDVLFIQITFRRGRSDAMKEELYRKITENLKEKTQVREEDVFIFLVENDFSDWSVGSGQASMKIQLVYK